MNRRLTSAIGICFASHRMGGAIAGLFVMAAAVVQGGDWPTYMHDNGRSGVTAESLAFPLSQQWKYQSNAEPRTAWPPPQPGWTELPKVDFDDAFYTVADAGQVYFGSSVDNKVYALDSKSGQIRWEFTTSGPIRLAPTLSENNVLFGSDDGRAYSLDKKNGELVWASQIAPGSKTVLGNGRPISLWPVRTGILVEGNRAFCGAGVFPYHRVYMAALDTSNGQVVWSSDAISNYGGFSPQGYMLTAGSQLIVPSGRATPLCLNREDGKVAFDFPRVGDKGATTGVYGLVADNVLYVGTQNTLYGIKTKEGTPAGKWANAAKILVTPDSYYLLQGPPSPAYGRRPIGGAKNDITCYDRQAYKSLEVKDVAGLKSVTRWRFPRREMVSMILAGNHLIAGGENEVVAIDTNTGKLVWEAKVAGLAVGLSVAHGRLLVSTTKGGIYCFSANGAKPDLAAKADAVIAWPEEPSATTVDAFAKGICWEAEAPKGYAVVMGNGGARLACEIAKYTELSIVCVETEKESLAAARKLVSMTGNYGSRVTVELGTPDVLPFPDYAANLIVQLRETGKPRISPREIARVLKPCGGVYLTGSWKATDEKIEGGEIQAALGKDKSVFTSDVAITAESKWGMLVRGPLAGSGWWTHQFADSGNRGSSGDQLIKGRLDVLWFGEPGADEFPDRHQRGPAPLALNGRVYCQGWDFLNRQTTLFCFDAYNGVRYWKRDVEGAIRLGLPAVPGNLACDEDSIYIANDAQCVRLDAVTGDTRATYKMPTRADGTRPEWGYLAIVDGTVIGSAGQETKSKFSDFIVAFDKDTAKPRWQVRTQEIRDTSFAIHEGRLFYAENRDPKPPPAEPLSKVRQLLPNESPGPYNRTIVALDLANGKPVWEKLVDLTDCGRWDDSMWGSLQSLCHDGVLVFAGAYTIYPSKAPPRPRKALALSTKTGDVLWNQEIGNKSRPVIMQGALLAEPLFFDLHNGKKIVREQPKSKREVPWSSGPRTGGCGSLSASDNMIFGRGGYTIWKDVTAGSTSAFVGTRPGCFINIIPAGGVVVQAEASSGCACYQAVQCTVVFRPRQTE